ncbi:MAG: hypothetical protein AAF828_06245 [Bacteroidota bacterium]
MRTFITLLFFALSLSVLSAQPTVNEGGNGGGVPTYEQGFAVGCSLASQFADPGRTWNQVFFDQSYNPVVYNTYNDARIRGWIMYAYGVREGFQSCYPRATWTNNRPDGCDPAFGDDCPNSPVGENP